MKDFNIVLENEFSKRWNSKPQGGVYEHFVCLCNRNFSDYRWVAGQPHRLIFKEDKIDGGTVLVTVDGLPYRWYSNWDSVMQDWILPNKITIYNFNNPAEQWVWTRGEGPECFLDGQ